MRKAAIAVVALPAILLLGAGAIAFLRVQHLLSHTRSQVAGEGRFEFDLSTFHRPENPGFESLVSPGKYTSGAAYQGKLYLAGPGGLAEFNSLNAPPNLLRTGLDLPPASVVGMATGTLRGEAHPQLILATHGEGVLLYDGSILRQLRPKDPAARDITALLPLPSGDLLLGTRQLGLLIYDGKTLTHFQNNLANLTISALAGDDGNFWIGTRNSGVFHWHAGQLDRFDTSSGLPDQQVESIVLAPGKIYVGTPLGVAEFDGSQNSRPARTLVPGFFSHALATDGNTLTIASIDEGIREISLTERHSTHIATAETLQAESFFPPADPHDGLLAVTSAGLARRQPSGEWQPLFTAATSPLTDSNISALNFAPDGRLWIGYYDRGLDILTLANSNETTQPARHVEDDHIFCVNRILADPSRHTVDVATANGLVLFDNSGDERQTLLRRDGLIADQVTDIAFTPGGTVLATPAGLTFIDSTGTHSLYAFHGLVNNHVYALATNASRSTLLAGTLGGISLLNDGVVHTNLSSRNSGLKQNWITAIVPITEDPASPPAWLIGTYGSGIMQLDAAGHIDAIEGATRPSVINSNAMLVTPQHIFAGSLSDGLFVYNRAADRWSRITTGLPSLNVTALAQHDGQLYVGTDNGIVHIAESRLTQ